MKLYRLRLLCIKIYKTFNSLKPSFMKEIFKTRKTYYITHDICKLNWNVRRRNHVTFATKSLKLINIKIAENPNAFKDLIKFEMACQATA